MIRQSYTAAVERNCVWNGTFATEPYESAWAKEAIFFVRALETTNVPSGTTARVQISPDGMHWCDEGTKLNLPTKPDQVTFCRTSQFGGWLRLVGELSSPAQIKVIVYLSLKE
jgi:hypothetical protein